MYKFVSWIFAISLLWQLNINASLTKIAFENYRKRQLSGKWRMEGSGRRRRSGGDQHDDDVAA